MHFVMGEEIPYGSADGFFSENKSVIIKGQEYYTSTQVAAVIGIDRNTVVRYAKEGFLEQLVGITHILDGNGRVLFSKHAIIKLYMNYFRTDGEKT